MALATHGAATFARRLALTSVPLPHGACRRTRPALMLLAFPSSTPALFLARLSPCACLLRRSANAELFLCLHGLPRGRRHHRQAPRDTHLPPGAAVHHTTHWAKYDAANAALSVAACDAGAKVWGSA